MAGVDIDYIGFDPAQAAIDGALKLINDNPAHITLAAQQLNAAEKDYTQADLLNLAIRNVQKTEAATLYIANSQVSRSSRVSESSLFHRLRHYCQT